MVLERLTCTRESDRSGGSEPYIWPVLIWIDDDTLSTPALVGVTSPSPVFARLVIKEDMRAGQVADIPEQVGVLRVRLDDNQSVRQLILVVALWESDDTPETAMHSGYSMFATALREAFGNFDTLMHLSQATTPEERQTIIDGIKSNVANRVHSAISSGLTSSEKARVFLGLLNLDDIVGSSFMAFPQLTAQTFSLAFTSNESPPSNLYAIDGQLMAVPVVADPCGAQARAVREAQDVVDNLNEQIQRLQAQLHGETEPGEPQLPKNYITAEIRRIRAEELPPAEAALEAARAALAACRGRYKAVSFPESGAVVTF